MPRHVATILRAMGVFMAFAGMGRGSDLHYTMSVEGRDATAHFLDSLTVTIDHLDGYQLSCSKGGQVLGVLGPTRRFYYEGCQWCPVSRKDATALLAELDALGLKDLPDKEPEEKNDSMTFGWLDWKGETKTFYTSPGSETRQKLLDALLAFVELQRKKHPREFHTQTDTLVGDDVMPVDVELKALLRTPKAYHGKRVRVTGYYHGEFEGSSFSVSKQASDKRDPSQSLWLGGPSSYADRHEIDYKNDSFLIVEGVFFAGDGGHMGVHPGAIRRVTKAIPK